MPTPNIETEKNKAPAEKKPALPDHLIKGGIGGKVELSEDELKDVSGGATGEHFPKGT